MDRDPGHRRTFQRPARPADLADSLRGGAIFAKWEAMGGEPTARSAQPKSPEAAADGAARYVTFDKGAIYWSPDSGAEPVTGAIYDAWASLGFERGALGLPTSGEIQEPQWIVQNFQHGTLNFDRETGTGHPGDRRRRAGASAAAGRRPAGPAGAVHADQPRSGARAPR